MSTMKSSTRTAFRFPDLRLRLDAAKNSGSGGPCRRPRIPPLERSRRRPRALPQRPRRREARCRHPTPPTVESGFLPWNYSADPKGSAPQTGPHGGRPVDLHVGGVPPPREACAVKREKRGEGTPPTPNLFPRFSVADGSKGPASQRGQGETRNSFRLKAYAQS